MGNYKELRLKQILFIASFGLLALLMQSCGNTIKVPEKIETEVSGEVEGDATIEHKHSFDFDLSTFKEVCEAEHSEVENEQLKAQLIEDCQAQRLEEFLDLLATLADEAEEEAEEE